MSEAAKKFIEKFVAIKNHVSQSEFVRISVGVFLVLGALLFLLPHFFNNSALKFHISQKAGQIFGADFEIIGKVEVAFLPSPTITLNHVFLRDYKKKSNINLSDKVYNLYARKAEIKLTVFNFSGGSTIKKIILSDAVMQTYPNSNEALVRNDKFDAIALEFLKNTAKNEIKQTSGITEKLFSISNIQSSEFSSDNTPRIVLKNSQAIFYDSFGKKIEVTKINSELGFSQKKIFAAGSFVSENLLSNFKINAKFNSAASKPDSFLELASPAAQIRISGNFASENLGIFSSDFNGKIEGEITEFKTFYKSYIGGDNPIAEKFRINGKPIKISAEIVSKAGETGIKNLILSSPLVNGKGEIDLDFTRNFPEIDVDLTLDNLDLDSVLSNDPTSVSSSELRQNNNSNSVDEVAETLPQKSESAEQQKSELIVDDLTKKIDLSLVKEIKNFDLNAEIKIDSIEFLSGQIRDANLYLKISREGEVIISPLIFTVPGQGKFRVSGVLDNSQVLPKFVGKLDANGQSLKEIFNWLKIESQNLKFENLKNYQIYSDILLVPNLTKFSNFYLSLSQDSSEFLGELTLDNSDKTPSIKSRFRGNNFNVDDYFLTSTGNLYLSSGSLIKKLFWLNEINVSADFDLSFDKLIYAGEEFLNQSMKLKFGRGYIQVDDMKLLSEQTDLTANILVDISEKSPQFMLNVAANNFHYEAAQDPEKTTKKNFFDQFFNLPSLAGFNGQVNTNFANLKLDEVFTKNVKLAAKLVDGNFKNTEFSCDLYGGNFTYTGLIGIGSSKVINGNVTFNNVVLKEFLPNAFGVKNISGIANFAANINASASQKSEFAKSLNSEINFSISAPTIEGYGLNDLVKKMFAPRLNVQELREPEKILINSVSYTAFQKASGSIKFNDGEGKVSAKVSGVAINGVLTGTIDAPQNSANLLFNVIFLTGTRQKQTPINIASSVSGKLDDLGQSINIDQVRQYFGLPKISTPALQSQLNQQPAMPDQLKSQIIQPTPAQ